MLFDMPLERLRDYRPEPEEPADFDAFWEKTLTESTRHGLDAEFVPYDAGFATVDVFDVTFRGWGGQPVKAWLMLPGNARVRCPPSCSTSGTTAAAASPTPGSPGALWATPIW